jgi:hypothetical protein
MTEPLRRRPEDLTAPERLALAMGRSVPAAPSDEEMRAYYAKLRRAKEEAGPPTRGRPTALSRIDADCEDPGLEAVQRLAKAMGRPVPPRPTEEECRAFQARLRRADAEAQRLYRERGGAIA